VRSNRRAGLETHVWTVNREADMARMLDYGVDNIITDRPKALRELIDERAELSDVELLLLALGRRLRE
jgi:glycerophosphoryl diester phosphodiesterase